MKKWLGLIVVLMILVGCGNNENEEASIRVMLDWTPNTNHTGLYVAQDQGYFEEEGLSVELMIPGQTSSVQSVATNQVEVGVASQQAITIARSEALPVVSILAIMQHNTSAFVVPSETGIDTPRDFEGLTYGGWGEPIERAMLEALMSEAGGDVDEVEILNIGMSDFFVALEREIDFGWMYVGWTGIEAERRGINLDQFWLTDYDEELDNYSPLIFTNETYLSEHPDVLERFVRAVSKGYTYSIENPEAAAEILLDAEPDLEEDLVYPSQAFLSQYYQKDAEVFGIQEESRWETFAQWLYRADIIDEVPNSNDSFTNQFIEQED